MNVNRKMVIPLNPCASRNPPSGLGGGPSSSAPGPGAEQELGIYSPYANPTQPPTEPRAVWVKNLLKFHLAASHDVLPFVRLTPLTAVYRFS